MKYVVISVALSAGATAFAVQGTASDPMTVRNGTIIGDLGAKLDGHMTAIAKDGFAGVVLVATDGHVVLANGYGLADRGKSIPYTTDTVFDVGSITKQFTGAATLKLEMEGKLATTDAINKHFKDVPEDKKDITLHHLLTHTAGFVDSLGDDYEAVSRDDFIQLALRSKLQAPPGKRYRYSNVGYSLLGTIIETVTGKRYETYLHDRLFKPAGLLRTGYLIPMWKPGELARGYHKDKDWGTPRDHLWASDGPHWHLRANGGVLSTVGDLYRWHVALEGGSVLSDAAKKKYFAPHVAEGPLTKSYYGYGWSIATTPRATQLITHNGGNGVFFADFRRYVDEKTVLIIASNVAEKSAESVSQALARMIFPRAP